MQQAAHQVFFADHEIEHRSFRVLIDSELAVTLEDKLPSSMATSIVTSLLAAEIYGSGALMFFWYSIRPVLRFHEQGGWSADFRGGPCLGAAARDTLITLAGFPGSLGQESEVTGS